jgi:transposase
MAMGKRKTCRQQPLFLAATDLPRTSAHPFYERLNQILAQHQFDPFVEGLCQPFYATILGRPSLEPGKYFHSLLLGYFEGIDSERGLAWRLADSFSLRDFVGYALYEATADHSTLSRTRRLSYATCWRRFHEWSGERGCFGSKGATADHNWSEINSIMSDLTVQHDPPIRLYYFTLPYPVLWDSINPLRCSRRLSCFASVESGRLLRSG